MAELIDDLMKAMITLQNRVTELESRLKNADTTPSDFRYRGVWEAGTYDVGNVVTYQGSMWHCNVMTYDPPGDGSKWTLCVKRGKSGRNGKNGRDGVDGRDGRNGRDAS